MVVGKRKKDSRQRGTMTHGWGSKKKHRGAGNRGGRGHAGSGKRGDAKNPTYVRIKNYFGKKGFTSKSRAIKIKAINLGYIENNFPALLKKGIVEKKGEYYTMDLGKFGYNKLLSAGKITKQYDITVSYASKKAVEKTEKLNGRVNLLSKESKESKEKKAEMIKKPVQAEKAEQTGKES